MKISSEFDSGNIDVLNVTSPTNIQLKLKRDNNACTRQWFHFCLDTRANEVHKIAIVNAGESSFSNPLTDYNVLASYDKKKVWVIGRQHPGETMAQSFIKAVNVSNGTKAISEKKLVQDHHSEV